MFHDRVKSASGIFSLNVNDLEAIITKGTVVTDCANLWTIGIRGVSGSQLINCVGLFLDIIPKVHRITTH